jgi:hypothetical protein
VPGRTKGSGTSGTFHEALSLEMLAIIQNEFKDQERAVVNFYPNGTCDEVLIILVSDSGERRTIMWELTTGLSKILTKEEEQEYVYGR